MQRGSIQLGNTKVVGDAPAQRLQFCDVPGPAALIGFLDCIVECRDDMFRKVGFDVTAMGERPNDGSQGKVSRVIHAGVVA